MDFLIICIQETFIKGTIHDIKYECRLKPLVALQLYIFFPTYKSNIIQRNNLIFHSQNHIQAHKHSLVFGEGCRNQRVQISIGNTGYSSQRIYRPDLCWI